MILALLLLSYVVVFIAGSRVGGHFARNQLPDLRPDAQVLRLVDAPPPEKVIQVNGVYGPFAMPASHACNLFGHIPGETPCSRCTNAVH